MGVLRRWIFARCFVAERGALALESYKRGYEAGLERGAIEGAMGAVELYRAVTGIELIRADDEFYWDLLDALRLQIEAREGAGR